MDLQEDASVLAMELSGALEVPRGHCIIMSLVDTSQVAVNGFSNIDLCRQASGPTTQQLPQNHKTYLMLIAKTAAEHTSEQQDWTWRLTWYTRALVDPGIGSGRTQRPKL